MGEALSGESNVTAYTEGDHIYFKNAGEYDPTTASGMALLVHEFTHVMQYREVAGFQAKYIKQYLKHGAGKKNPYEKRGYINGEKSEKYFNDLLNKKNSKFYPVCLPGEE